VLEAATKPRARFEVTADGDGLVGHAGAALLAELAERLGLPAEVDRWARAEGSRAGLGTGLARWWSTLRSCWPMVGTA
jgi:hypothetical protein